MGFQVVVRVESSGSGNDQSGRMAYTAGTTVPGTELPTAASAHMKMARSNNKFGSRTRPKLDPRIGLGRLANSITARHKELAHDLPNR
jgi:hypothetical protein